MSYKIETWFQQGDSTGNNPTVDIIWNEQTVVNSATITKPIQESMIDRNADIVSFSVDSLQSSNTILFNYTNKPSGDTTNETKVKVCTIVVYEEFPNHWYQVEVDSNINPKTQSQFFDINPLFLCWSSATVDGESVIPHFDELPPEKEYGFWGLSIQNSNASLQINWPGTTLNTFNTFTYSNISASGNVVSTFSRVKIN